MDDSLKIAWYGRCCFLVEYKGKRILFDPYDRFCNVDIGLIESEILISSSTWHDHGHIGASPGSWIFTYPGNFKHLDFTINGYEVKEERGSPTVVFNIQFGGFSITNFADMGIYSSNIFTEEQKAVLASTNIAFIRAGHQEVLNFCDPRIIIPEHYFPLNFIQEQLPDNLKNEFEQPVKETDKLLESLKYPVKEIDNYWCTFNENSLKEKTVIKFLKLHPQVRYTLNPHIKMFW